MLYSALGFFILSLAMLVLGWTGVVHGAAGLVSLLLFVSLGLVVGKALALAHENHQPPLHH